MLYAPLYIDFNLTAHCNFKCNFCYTCTTSLLRKNELSLNDINEILNEMQQIGVLRVNISGGEPFLRNDVIDILNLIKKYDQITYSLNTNGSLIDVDKAKAISQIPFVSVGVSLDGPTEEIFDKNRKSGGKWNDTLRGINNLLKENVPVSCGITLSKYNVNCIPATLDFAYNMGINAVSIQFVCPPNKDVNKILPDFDLWSKALLELTDLKLNNQLPVKVELNPVNECVIPWELYIPHFRSRRLDDLKKAWDIEVDLSQNKTFNISCVGGKTTLAIAANGDIFPCEMFLTDKNMVMGNAIKDGIKKVWDTAPRKIPNEKKMLDGYCSNCLFSFCGAGCRASALHLTGNINASDYRCPLVIENEKGKLV